MNVAGSARTVGAWTGTATLDPGAGNDLVRIELTGSTGMTVHVLDTAGVDRLSVLGTTAPDGLIVDVVSSPPAGTGAGRVRRVAFDNVGFMTSRGTITHSGVELVETATLTGGDRVAVQAFGVESRISTGEHGDRIAVGFRAVGSGTTNTAWTNNGGTSMPSSPHSSSTVAPESTCRAWTTPRHGPQHPTTSCAGPTARRTWPSCGSTSPSEMPTRPPDRHPRDVGRGADAKLTPQPGPQIDLSGPGSVPAQDARPGSRSPGRRTHTPAPVP